MNAPKPKFILICGLPGSGKTTLAKRLEGELNAVRFCPDEWMEAFGIDLYDEGRRGKIEAFQWTLARRLLRLGLSVIIEWGCWARSERDKLREEAKALGAETELHTLLASADVLVERVRRRGMENPPLKREDIARWMEAFQAPTPDEKALFDRSFSS